MRWADDPRRAAVYAACAFALAGPLIIVGALANGHTYAGTGGSVLPIYLAGFGAVVVAGIIPFLPWRRWGMRATIVLPVLALGMLMAGEITSRSSRTVDGVMSTSGVVTMIFVWIGVTQPRWTSMWAMPIVALGLSIAFAAEDAHVSVATTIVSVLLSAVIGELIAWVKHADTARSDELGRLIDGNSELRNETDPISAAGHLVDTVAGLLGVPNVAVYLSDGTNELTLVSARGEVEFARLRPFSAATGISVRRVDAGTELSIPLVGRSGNVRGLAVGTGRRRQDEFMLRLAQILGEQAGHRLDDLAVLDALSDESRRDVLTGVGNRRQAVERLGQLRERDVIAVIDLDDLRGINQRSGHHGGDEAIRAVAQYLCDAVRSGDEVARLGGDEFVVFLHDVGPAAFPLIERIAEDWNLANPDVTFSVGAAVYAGEDPESTLRAADDALFQAKHDGKARAHVAEVDAPPHPMSDVAGF